jgi:hypothetical protein
MTPDGLGRITMVTRLYRAFVFALYQFSIVVGITFLPLALVAKRAGVPLPLGRLVERLGDAYERAARTTEEPAA